VLPLALLWLEEYEKLATAAGTFMAGIYEPLLARLSQCRGSFRLGREMLKKSRQLSSDPLLSNLEIVRLSAAEYRDDFAAMASDDEPLFTECFELLDDMVGPDSKLFTVYPSFADPVMQLWLRMARLNKVSLQDALDVAERWHENMPSSFLAQWYVAVICTMLGMAGNENNAESARTMWTGIKQRGNKNPRIEEWLGNPNEGFAGLLHWTQVGSQSHLFHQLPAGAKDCLREFGGPHTMVLIIILWWSNRTRQRTDSYSGMVCGFSSPQAHWHLLLPPPVFPRT
jgi:hypothetical protein